MKTNTDYNKFIAHTFNLVAAMIVSYNNKYSCYSKKFNSFFSLPGATKLNIEAFPDCLISFEVFTHKEDLKNPIYNRGAIVGYEEQKITVKELIVLVFENTTFVLPNNNETIKELANKMIGKVSKLSEYSEVKALGNFKQPEEVFTKICELDNEAIETILQAEKFMANDDLRPVMNNVLIDPENIVSSDAHQLFNKPHNIEIESELLIPFQGLKFLRANRNKKTSKHFKNYGTIFNVFKSLESIKIEKDGKEYIYPILNESYPKYKNAYPPVNSETTINRIDLINAISQTAIFANQASNLVRLYFNGHCEVSSADIDYSIGSKVHLNIENSTFEGEIGFRSNLLLNVLSTSKQENIKILFSDNTRGAIFDNCLLMPMLIN